MIGVGGVPQPERECDPERDQQGGAAEQAGEPGVELLHRPEQELEVDQGHRYLLVDRTVIRAAGLPLK